MKKTVALLCICFLCKQFVSAQLCTGSLGDPIVNFTFGNTPGLLKFGITSMSYISSGCPQDGSYTVTHSTTGCFNGTWHNALTDHTGNTNGQFMLINASFTPSDFYLDTVKGLCGNTTYEFASWVANMLRPNACDGNGIKPNLTFRIETIDGKVLIKYDSGDIPPSSSFLWTQYGTFFKTPIGASDVVLRITNNAVGGCGNDLALDDITFRPCGQSVFATVRNQPGTAVSFCDGNTQSYILDATTTGSFAGATIQWQVSTDSGQVWKDITGAQSTSYTRLPTAAGYYQYRIVVAETANFASVQCRIASNVITIEVKPLPKFIAKNFVLGCISSDLTLETLQGSGYTYQWSGPNGFSSTVYNPVLHNVTYVDSGLYRVLVTNSSGCSATDSFPVRVFPGADAQVSASAVICEGASVALAASGGSPYSWAPATGLSSPQISNPIASPSDTTTYTVTVTNQYGCKDSASTTVNVLKNPVINAGPDKKIFEGETVLLEGSIAGNYTGFYWAPNTYMSNTNSLTPLINPSDSITYTLYVSAGAGCPAVSDNVFIQVYKKISVPNIFTPNGDGIYDTWIIKGIETYPDAITRVYSRNGMLMFQARSASQVWNGTFNGKPLPVATYYYIIDLNMGLPKISGWVVIMR